MDSSQLRNNSSLDGGLEFQPLFNEPMSACFTVVYVFIFIVALLGNVSTCLVIIKRQYMHSATNFYLCNLAISDLIILLIGLPTDVYLFWKPHKAIGGTWFCIFKGFVTETASNASILTIVTFTFERWVNICHPFKASSNPNWGVQQNFKKIIRNIWLIWVLASIFAAPICVQLGVIEFSSEYSQCDVVASRELPYSFEISSVLFFVIPMTLIPAFYLLIIVELRRTLRKAFSELDSPLTQSTRGTRQQAKASSAVVKILVAVVLAFFICFLPFHVQRLLATYLQEKRANDADNEQLAKFSQILFMTSGVLYYFSTTANPLIYNILSRRFRVAFKEVLFCHKRTTKGGPSPKIVKTTKSLRAKAPVKICEKSNQQCSPFLLSSPPRQPRRCYAYSSENRSKSPNRCSPDNTSNVRVIQRDVPRPITFLLVNNRCNNQYVSKIWSDICPRNSAVNSFDGSYWQGASV